MASRVVAQKTVPHLMTLADLTVPQIEQTLRHSLRLKQLSQPWLVPQGSLPAKKVKKLKLPPQSLFNKTIALLFSKRSTRTRLAAETSATLLGGRALFLGRDDIQLGVNETPRDTARVIGGMCQGIFARVGDHSEIEELAKHSPVPVLNALSSLWHPTQILADLLTLHEHAHLFAGKSSPASEYGWQDLRPLTIAYVGDANNILNDMVEELGCDKGIWWGTDPREAVKGADVVVTDTWISMGQEAEKAERLQAFDGYQVTEQLCEEGGANPDWKFMHCLPRKQNEVDDEVFYGPRSLVFPEADNRKWTIMALFDNLFGKWAHGLPPRDQKKEDEDDD
ncbi:hypothetical protein H1R20_g3373, partial [Candolleomyces eurysporus]